MNEKQQDYLRDSILDLSDNFLGSDYNLDEEQIAEISTVISEHLYGLKVKNVKSLDDMSKNIYNSQLFAMLDENVNLYNEKTQKGYDQADEFEGLVSRLQDAMQGIVSNHAEFPAFNIDENFTVSFRMEPTNAQNPEAKMNEKQKEYLQKAIFNLTDYFNGANYDLAQNQIDELYTIVSGPIFDLEPSKVTMSDKHTMSVFDSELFEVLDENINLFQEKVQEGKNENEEFEKLVTALKNRMEGLVLNHNKSPIFNVDENLSFSFNRKIDKDYIQESIMKRLVEASPEQGGLGVSPPQTAKELSENPYIDLKDLVRNITSNYIDKGAEHTLDTIRLYQLSYKQREDGYVLELLVKISEFMVGLNPNLSDYRIRKTEAQLTQQEKDLNQSISNYIRSQSEDELRDYVKEAKNDFFYKSDFNTDEEKQEFILDNTILGQRKATTDSDELLKLAIRSYVNTKSRQQLEDLVREYKDTFFYESDFGTTEERYDFILEHGAKTGLETRKKQVLGFIFEGTLLLTADQVSTPEDPSQQEVMDLISNITTIKELGSFIRSTTFASGDKRELNRQKVVEFIKELRLEASSTAKSNNSPQARTKKNSKKITQPL